MSTTISISVGPVSASRTFANDAKAQATLLAFYEAFELGPADATNRDKLQMVVDWIVEHIRRRAIVRHIELERSQSELEAGTLYGFE